MSTATDSNLIALRIYVNTDFEETKSFDGTKDIMKIAEVSRDEIKLDTLQQTIKHHSFLGEKWVNDLLRSDEYICKLASFEYPEIAIDGDDELRDEIETFVDLDAGTEEYDITDTATCCKLRMYFKKIKEYPQIEYDSSPGIPDNDDYNNESKNSNDELSDSHIAEESENEEWECSKCTFLNTGTSSHCEICQNNKNSQNNGNNMMETTDVWEWKGDIQSADNHMFNGPSPSLLEPAPTHSFSTPNTICDEPLEHKNDLQVARLHIADIACNSCNFKLGQHKLYFCDNCESDKIYCIECGPFSHRSATGKDHKWGVGVVEIPIINSSNYQDGANYIINLLGAERYNNVIVPQLRVFSKTVLTVNSAAAVMNNGKNMYLAYNLSKASTAAVSAANKFGNAAMKAIKTQSDVANAAKHALQAANDAKDAVCHAQEMREIYTVASDHNPFYWLYNWLYKDHADEAVTIYKEAVAARELAHSKAAEYAKQSLQARNVAASAQQKAQLAKQFAESKGAEATTAAAVAQDSMKLSNTLKSAAYVTAGLTVLEMFVHGYKYGRNQISGREFCRLSGKSLSRNTASMVGTAIGTQIGVLAGSQLGSVLGDSICPGFGAIAGTGVGLLGAMFLSWKLGAYAEDMYERVFPPRNEVIHEALIYFHFTEDDIDNPQVFNLKRIKKEYKNAALLAHPDKNDGSHTKWNILSTNYGILMGLLEQNNQNKKIVKDSVIQSLQQ